MPQIHPSAVIADGASIAAGSVIGPWCVIGPEVVIEAGVTLANNVVVEGRTRVGAGTRVGAFASLGTEPQDMKYKGQPTECEIGPRCLIREHASVNRASVGGDGLTRIGADCMVMIGAHVGHDCKVGNGVILANNVMLGGHVHVGDNAFLGGGAAITQTVHIGRMAMISGLSGVTNDIPPFGYVFGLPARLVGFNLVGMRRRGFRLADIRLMRGLLRLLFNAPGVFAERLRQAEAEFGADPLGREVLDFVTNPARHRALVRAGRMAGMEGEAEEAEAVT